MELEYIDYRKDPAAWAKLLGISKEAVDLYLSSEVIDLHTCSFMWERIFPGYDMRKRHRAFLPGSFAFNQVDLPRAREAQMAAVSWDVTTNPFRFSSSRPPTAVQNIRKIVETLKQFPQDFRVARTYSEYKAARAAGCTASLISIQGGLALDHSPDSLDLIPDDLVHRITVVHLTESRLGAPNSQPQKARKGLTPLGRDFVRKMQSKKILVDLAHINRQGFFDALGVCDPSIPAVVTHTGIQAVCPSWRNIDDEQIKAIADCGGTIGIIYHPYYLAKGNYLYCPLERVIDHMEHVIQVAGEDFVSLGSDYDGLIALPTDFHDITHQPKLVDLMLGRGWSDECIRKILGENFLRVLKAVRP